MSYVSVGMLVIIVGAIYASLFHANLLNGNY